MAPAGPDTTIDRLLGELFPPNELSLELAREMRVWLASAWFRSFVEANRDKIRRKLRGASDPEARRDVRAELRLAYLLLTDRRIELTYEPYGSGKRGPDFTAAFRGERDINVEVTRLHGEPDETAVAWLILAKLRQLPPSVPNVLVAAVDAPGASTVDVAAAVRWLRSRADRKDEAFFAERGFDGTRDFYERFLRLGAVVVWSETAAEADRAALWTNGSARIPVPPRAARACAVCLGASQ